MLSAKQNDTCHLELKLINPLRYPHVILLQKKKSTCRAWNTAALRTRIRTSHTKCTIGTNGGKFFFGTAFSTWKARAKQTTFFWISTIFEYYVEGWRWSTLTKEINITCLFITHRGKQDRQGDARSSYRYM